MTTCSCSFQLGTSFCQSNVIHTYCKLHTNYEYILLIQSLPYHFISALFHIICSTSAEKTLSANGTDCLSGIGCIKKALFRTLLSASETLMNALWSQPKKPFCVACSRRFVRQ